MKTYVDQKYTDETKKLPYPHTVIIEASTRCNIRCVTCPRIRDDRIQPKGSRYGDMSLEIFDRIKEYLSCFREVILSGCGESLLNKHFLYMLQSAKNAGCTVSYITNATLIVKTVAYKIVDYGLDELIISIDATSPDLFRKIRKGAELQQVLHAIEIINHFKNLKNSSKPKLIIEMVPMQQNIYQLPDMVKLANTIGVARIKLAALVIFQHLKEQSLLLRPDLIKKYFIRAQRLASRFQIELDLPQSYMVFANIEKNMALNAVFWNLVFHPIKTAFELKTKLRSRAWFYHIYYKYLTSRQYVTQMPANNKHTRAFCHEPWNLCYFANNGDVQPCCTLDFSVGNILKTNFSDIWNSNSYNTLREQMFSNKPPHLCVQCRSQHLDYTM